MTFLHWRRALAPIHALVLVCGTPCSAKGRLPVPTSAVVTPRLVQVVALRHANELMANPSSLRRAALAMQRSPLDARRLRVIGFANSGPTPAIAGQTHAVTISVLGYGPYHGEPALTRRYEFVYSAKTGALISEIVTPSDDATAARFGFPTLRGTGIVRPVKR